MAKTGLGATLLSEILNNVSGGIGEVGDRNIIEASQSNVPGALEILGRYIAQGERYVDDPKNRFNNAWDAMDEVGRYSERGMNAIERQRRINADRAKRIQEYKKKYSK